MVAGRKNNEKQLLESLADDSGLAIVIANGKSAPVEGANNNSICRALYSSEAFAPRCDEFCGKAFDWATEAGKPVAYRCHANLNCLAVPLETPENRFVAIVGRTFTKAADYREATEKALVGEWREFSPTQLFENVLLTGAPQNLEKLANRLRRLSEEEKRKLFEAVNFENDEKETPFEKISVRAEAEEITAWRSLFGSLLQLEYRRACDLILKFLHERYGLISMIWLENKDNRLEIVSAVGDLKQRGAQIEISADDERLLEAARNGTALELHERKSQDSAGQQQIINLFPITVGGEVSNALAISDVLENVKEKRKLVHFCRTIASDLEILRLRDELSRRNWMAQTVRKFNESLKKIDAEDFWVNLTQICAELLTAERASLLIYNEKSDVFEPKALIGVVNVLSDETTIGEKVARKVLQSGAPMVVADIKQIAFASAPTEWKYKTDSFLSCPIMIDNRKIAVLNFTDRADREVFSSFDLEILQAIIPQIAVAVDHALLKDKANEFEYLSITDAMTKLPNKLYLERRLTEEINRSKRHRFPLSLMMIDVDFFKSYNDTFGHIEGDKALKIVGLELKESLRAVDVAARFGGEEFSILLPQTTLEEAKIIAERVRTRIENTDFPNRKVTVSIGVASCSPEVNCFEDLVLFADKALYEAKRKGRNNVQIYGSFENTKGE